MNPYLAIQRIFICVKEDHDEWSILLRGEITHEECRMIASYLQQQRVMTRGWHICEYTDPIYRYGFYNQYFVIEPKRIEPFYWNNGTVHMLMDEILTLRHKIVKFISWQQFLNQRIPRTTEQELHQAVSQLSDEEIAELRYTEPR